MPQASVTILGGGNTAFSTAASLTLRGFEVTLFEIEGFEASLDPVRESSIIHLLGECGQGPARIRCLTTDIEEALAASELVLLIVPAYAHKPFAEVCAPHLGSRHTVVLLPGTLGTLEWSQILRRRGGAAVTLAEVDTAPYVCRKTAPDTATIWGAVSGLGLGVLPASETARVREALEPLFPGMQTYPDVMACGLAAMNPVVHPAGVLLNAGRVEYSKGEFYFYEEGVTPSVVKVIGQVDEERRAVARALSRGGGLSPGRLRTQGGFVGRHQRKLDADPPEGARDPGEPLADRRHPLRPGCLGIGGKPVWGADTHPAQPGRHRIHRHGFRRLEGGTRPGTTGDLRDEQGPSPGFPGNRFPVARVSQPAAGRAGPVGFMAAARSSENRRELPPPPHPASRWPPSGLRRPAGNAPRR